MDRKLFFNGFTLVELLVVIAIMALIGAYMLSNYGSFGEDQKLKNAVLDVVSLLRQAQSNATTKVVCAGNWQVEFTDATTVNLICVSSQKELKLDKISPDISISGVSGTPSVSCPSATGFTVILAPFTGNINVASYPDCTSLTVTVINSKLPLGSNTKSLKIERGGRIYAN